MMASPFNGLVLMIDVLITYLALVLHLLCSQLTKLLAVFLGTLSVSVNDVLDQIAAFVKQTATELALVLSSMIPCGCAGTGFLFPVRRLGS